MYAIDKLINGMINNYASHITQHMPDCPSDISCSKFVKDCYEFGGISGLVYSIGGPQGTIDHPSHRNMARAYVDIASMDTKEALGLTLSTAYKSIANLLDWRGKSKGMQDGIQSAMHAKPSSTTALSAFLLLMFASAQVYGDGPSYKNDALAGQSGTTESGQAAVCEDSSLWADKTGVPGSWGDINGNGKKDSCDDVYRWVTWERSVDKNGKVIYFDATISGSGAGPFASSIKVH